MSKVRSIRASEVDWDRWAVAARESNRTLNAWVIDSLNLVAERDLAEFRRAANDRDERERVRRAMAGLHDA